MGISETATDPSRSNWMMTLANGAATAQSPIFDSESFNDKVIDHVHSVEISMKWWAILQRLIPLGAGLRAPQQIVSTGRRFSFIFLNEQNWGLMVATNLDLLLLWPAQLQLCHRHKAMAMLLTIPFCEQTHRHTREHGQRWRWVICSCRVGCS